VQSHNKESWQPYTGSLDGNEPEPQPQYPLTAEEAGPDSAWVVSRRSFLRATGFTVAGAGMAGTALLSGCAPAPVRRAIPLTQGVEGQFPGKAQWYATVCGGCPAGCGVLAKVRDGRPIKLEGLPGHPLSQGGLCAVGQAYLLELYDSRRLTGPMLDGKPTTWAAADAALLPGLQQAASNGQGVRVLAAGLTSPALRAQIQSFLTQFQDATLVEYDPVSVTAIRDAHQQTHGARLLPWYRFENADLVVSFGADFLGTWIAPVAFTAGWRTRRTPDGEHPSSSRVVMCESRMSLTGSKADTRWVMHPGEIPHAIGRLAWHLAQKTGQAIVGLPRDPHRMDADLGSLADALLHAKRHSLVICGLNDPAAQMAINSINQLLDNYGHTLDVEHPILAWQGNDHALAQLKADLTAKRVGALFLVGSNPVYHLPDGEEWGALIKSVPWSVSTAAHSDESASVCRLIAPDHHPLEAWRDAEVRAGLAAIQQPTINPLHNTRNVLVSFAAWQGTPAAERALVEHYWQTTIFARQREYQQPRQFWNTALSRGYATLDPGGFELASAEPAPSMTSGSLDSTDLNVTVLECYPSIAMRTGEHALNPWLHELPDPLTKMTWENALLLDPSRARSLGVSQGDLVRLSVGDRAVELPAYIQPGQHPNVVAVALGYGRVGTERFADVGPVWLERRSWQQGKVGVSVEPLLPVSDLRTLHQKGVQLAATGTHRPLATTQQHHTLETPRALLPPGSAKRPHVHDTTLAGLTAWIQHQEEHHHPSGDMWPADHVYDKEKWGMVIDLNACTGCAGCVIACQAENNIPVVGKDEVIRGREMHWLRIDRYYREDGDATLVAHQPMLCQQCDNAPCETVCPVLATVHSEDGLNQQVYNRCVGTRYCANNCPYKVRRFNWFDYPHQDPIENLVLNPDVAVRTRGVMEKCTFCAQRIIEARIAAKAQGIPIPDGAIEPACMQSCPAKAISFGNTVDPASSVSLAMASQRTHLVLGELNVKPAVGYQAIVRNPLNDQGGTHG